MSEILLDWLTCHLTLGMWTRKIEYCPKLNIQNWDVSILKNGATCHGRRKENRISD